MYLLKIDIFGWGLFLYSSLSDNLKILPHETFYSLYMLLISV